MRPVSRATWTSGEPVSLSPRLLSSMILTVSMDIAYLPLVMRGPQERPHAAWHGCAPREPPLAVGTPGALHGRTDGLKKPRNCNARRAGRTRRDQPVAAAPPVPG